MTPEDRLRELLHEHDDVPVTGDGLARIRQRLEARRSGTHYEALVRSIVFQQLSGKAARTIHDRFRALYPAFPIVPSKVSSRAKSTRSRSTPPPAC